MLTDVGTGSVESSPPISEAQGTRRGRVAVVVNGNAKHVTEEVLSTLDRILLGGDLFVSGSLQDAKEIAHTIVSRGYETVLTGGGDGTFTVMVSEVVHEGRRQGKELPRFGLLKLGTGNALAWVVGAGTSGKKNLAADIRRLREDAGSRELRLVEVGGQLAPFCGFGADARILSDYAWVKSLLAPTPIRALGSGIAGYGVAAVTRSLPSYLVDRMPRCVIVNRGAAARRLGNSEGPEARPIESGEVLYEGPIRLAALSTIPYFGFGFRMFPYAEERSDRMHLRVSTIGLLPFIWNFQSIWRGSYDNPGSVFDFLVESVEIRISPACPFQVGGDAAGIRSRIVATLSREPIRLVDFYSPPRLP